MPEEESGLDELMRLSRKFTKQQEEHDKQERQRAEQGKKVKGVLQGLKDLNLSMALNQLKTVAKPEIIRQVTALKTGEGTENLRKADYHPHRRHGKATGHGIRSQSGNDTPGQLRENA